MKKVLFMAALTALSFTGFAQDETSSDDKTFTFSLGIEPSLPIGDFGDTYGFGIGGSVQGDYKLASDLAITLNAGYISYSGKEITVLPGFPALEADALGVVPVLAGIRYWFSPNIYGSGQLGVSFLTGSGDGTSFTYAPGVGFKFSKFDILLKYTGFSVESAGVSGTGTITTEKTNLSSIGLRAAYNF